MRGWLAIPLMVVACGGPVDSTLVDELRVVAAIPQVAELGPGEAFSVDTTVVQPDGDAVDLLVWMCTPTGGPGAPCLEAAQSDGSGWMTVLRGAEQRSEVALALSPALTPGLGETPIAIPMWVLACDVGLCDIIADAESGIARGDVGDVAAQLADTTSLLQGLPITGTAATKRSLYASARPEEARNVHPVVLDGPEEPLAGDSEVGATFSLQLDDSGPLTAYAYATAGGFSEAATDAGDVGVDLTWFAPTEGEGEATLFVVVQDEAGGEALWEGVASIQR